MSRQISVIHSLGFPRIGARRELKFALEKYWRDELGQAQLQQVARDLRARHWAQQAQAGLDYFTVGDFAFYDQVLDTSAMLGCVPARFRHAGGNLDLDTAFRMARGRAPTGADTDACEMTKWFDTNYHYLVPEFEVGQQFSLSSESLFEQVEEAQAQGYPVKAVILGPLTWLWLGKAQSGVDKLDLLDSLLPVYREILARLAAQGVEWLQIDEPALVLDLPPQWQQAYRRVYAELAQAGPKLLLASYFGALGDNLDTVLALPVHGLHIDAVRAPEQLVEVAERLGSDQVLSAGVINGRNIWRADLDALLQRLQPLHAQLQDRLWLAPSCSLLHVPVDLEQEEGLDAELGSWLAFAVQKLGELDLLRRALAGSSDAQVAALTAQRQALQARRRSRRIHKSAVRERAAGVTDAMARRACSYKERAQKQHERFALPLYPTTTIGSFPQTGAIRKARSQFRAGEIPGDTYRHRMEAAIAEAVFRQEKLGLDVLVHGEAERNDMVEYFGEQLEGFAFTRFGWVQSYGSRCVKPPIIYGDVSRLKPMTVEWAVYAQSLTGRPMKGMLTGPVTILQWSFVRDDQPRAETCLQIALALRDEVLDLERAGIGMIQIDEPALREGLPLRRAEWQDYLDWAVQAFRVTAAGVDDATQIHTHMCYAEFNDIIEAIAALDADVITIETSRSQMELLAAFEDYEYPNEIGPGVYDIHSPQLPETGHMVSLLQRAARNLPASRLWVNPDCGLKTRRWEEVEPALQRMVEAAQELRQQAA